MNERIKRERERREQLEQRERPRAPRENDETRAQRQRIYDEQIANGNSFDFMYGGK